MKFSLRIKNPKGFFMKAGIIGFLTFALQADLFNITQLCYIQSRSDLL